MAKIFDKRLKYVGNDLETWEMTNICGKWLRNRDHGLRV